MKYFYRMMQTVPPGWEPVWVLMWLMYADVRRLARPHKIAFKKYEGEAK